MGSFNEKLEKLRKQPYEVRRRVVAAIAGILTIVLVGGIWGVKATINGIKNRENLDSNVRVQSPFSTIRDTWESMVEYIEKVSGSIVPERNPFSKDDEEDGEGFLNHPGVKLEPLGNETEEAQ